MKPIAEQARALYQDIRDAKLTPDDALAALAQLRARSRQESVATAQICLIEPVAIAADALFLRDHTVDGDPVLIGVTHACLAIEAFHRRHTDAPGIRLHALSFVEPVRVVDSETIQLRTAGSLDNDNTDVEVQFMVGNTPGWAIGARGKIGTFIPAIARLDLASLGLQLDQRFNVQDIYRANPHVRWGSTFLTVSSARHDHGRCLIEVEMPATSGGMPAFKILDPWVANSALLAAFPLIAAQSIENVFLPFAIKDIQVQTHPAGPVRWILASNLRYSGEMITFDVQAADETGKVVATFFGYSLKRLRKEFHATEIKTDHAAAALSSDIQELPARALAFLIEIVQPALPMQLRGRELSVNLMELGLDSAQLVSLTGQISSKLGIELFATVFFEYPSLQELAEHLASAHPECFASASGRDRPAPNFTASASAAVPGYPEHQAHGHRPDHDIAIIGMAGRLAQSPDLETFWSHLQSAHDLVTEVPAERWKLQDWYDADRQANHKTYSRWGSFIDGIDEFDPLFFGISPRNATWMDPQVRLQLEVVYNAAEDAGYASRIRGSNTGMYTGVCFQEYWDEIIRRGVALSGHEHPSAYRSSTAAQVSFSLDLQGPSIPVDNACASSLTALHLACQALRAGDCDMAFATGINVLLSPLQYVYFSRIQAMSPTGRCRPFDRLADGFVPGEGIVAVMLKPLAAALRDGDAIHAVIKGSAVNHVGKSQNATAPRPQLQTQVIEKAWRDADVDPSTISYIECHGTGTSLGDPIEIEGLKAAFARQTTQTGFCALGSTKANVGHLEGAAGLAGLIKVVLAMQHGKIPRMPHFEKLNPMIRLEQSPFFINPELIPWEATDGTPLRAGISSFGMTGNNAHVIIESPPLPACPATGCGQTPGVPQLMIVSAQSEAQLRAHVAQILRATQAFPDEPCTLRNLAYTLQMGREAMSIRVATVVASLADLRTSWQAYLQGVPASNCSFSAESLTKVLGQAERHPASPLGLQASDIGARWLKGESFDWKLLYQGQRPTMLRLPSYPFERKRYWGLPAAEPVAHFEQAASIDQVMFAPRWRPVDDASEPLPVPPGTGNALIVVGPDSGLSISLARELAQRLRVAAASHHVALLVLTRDEHTAPTGPDEWRLRIDEPNRFAQHLQASLARTEAINRLFVIGGDDADASGPELEISVLRLLKRLFNEPALIANTIDTYFIVRDSQAIRDEAVHSAHAGLTGLGYALAQGEQRYRVRNLDIASAEMADTAARECLMDQILSSRASASGETTVWRQGRCWRQSFDEVTAPASASDAPATSAIRQHGVYVIAGGAGTVGRVITAYLQSKYQAQVIWLGRRAASEPSIQALLSGTGADQPKPEYIQADVTKLESMREAVASIVNRFGPIHGAIFSSVVFEFDTPLATIEESTFRHIFDVKSRGSEVFHQAFSASNLDFMCFFSSAQAFSFSGAASLAAYASGITKAAALVKSLSRRSKYPIGMIHWGFWRAFLERTELGERVRHHQHLGALSDAVGCRCFERCVGELAARTSNEMICMQASNVVRASMGLGTLPSADTMRAKPAAPEPKNSPPGTSSSEPVDRTTPVDRLHRSLAASVARTLLVPQENINPKISFADYGVDSLTGLALIRDINESLGLDLNVAVIYEHASLQRLHRFIMRDFGELAARQLASTERPAVQENRANATDSNTQIRALAAADPRRPTPQSSGIAVIGMSIQAPDAPDLDTFWRNQLSGHDAVVSPSRGRLPAEDGFDPLFFNVSPREADAMTRQQRLIMIEGWRALEDAACKPSSLDGLRVGIFVGTEPTGQVTESFTGHSDAIIASRLSYLLNLRGPAMVVNTGCSSGAVALHLACQSLRSNESSMALAGGVFADLTASTLGRLSGMGMLSVSGQCRSFDEKADGTVLSEGAAMLVLKRLEDAQRDGDPIHGVILASAVNQDGASNGITAPNGDAQEALLRETYALSGISPDAVSYIEAHGTGTILGDPVEVNALHRVFDFPDAHDPKAGACVLGSTKSHIGHTSAAAGIIGVVKVLLAMRHQIIPGTLHFSTLNPRIQATSGRLRVSRDNTAWPSGQRVAGLNAFGHSGTNVHLVIAEPAIGARTIPNTSQSKNRAVMVPLSARTLDQLERRAQQTLHLLGLEPVDLESLAYTLQTGREELRERIAFVCASQAQLVHQLQAFLAGDTVTQGYRSSSRKILGPITHTPHFDELAAGWAQGHSIDWQTLWPEGTAYLQRLHLPACSFAAVELPQRADQHEQTGDRASRCRSGPPPDLMRVLAWKTEQLDSVFPARPPAPSSRVLVVSTQADSPLEAALRALHLARGDQFVSTCMPERADQESWKQLQALMQSFSATRFYLILTAMTDPLDAVAALTRTHELGLLRLTRQIKQSCAEELIDCVIVTQDNFRVGDHLAHAWGGGVTGLGYAIAQGEHRFLVRNLDVSHEDLGSPEDAIRLARQIIEEPPSSRGDVVKLHQGMRYVQQFVDLDTAQPVPPALERGSVVVIAGGSGTVGQAISRGLAEDLDAQIIWLGRSAPVEPALQAKLDRFKQQGIAIEYLQADVTDQKQMQHAVQTILARHGHIDAALFSSLVFDFENAVGTTTESAFDEVFRVKSLGSMVFYEAFRGVALKLMCFFSSGQAFSFSGASKFSAYASGITFSDGYVRAVQSQPPFPVGIINWGFWGSAEANTRFGSSIERMDDTEGYACFSYFCGLLCARQLNQVLCMRVTDPIRKLMKSLDTEVIRIAEARKTSVIDKLWQPSLKNI